MTDLANFVPIGPRIVTDGALRHLDQTVLTVWNDKTKSADRRDGPTPDYEVDVTDTGAVRDMVLARAAAKRAPSARASVWSLKCDKPGDRRPLGRSISTRSFR